MENTDPLWQSLPPVGHENTKGQIMIDPATAVNLMRAEGHNVTVTEAGEVTEDADGIPAWVAPPTVTDAMLCPLVLTGHEWENVAYYLLAQLDKKENTK